MRVLVTIIAAAACTDPPPAEWGYVYATVIAPSCTTSACHSTLSAAGSLDLHDASAAYQALTGRSCDDATSPVAGYVDPEEPTRSILSTRLRLPGPMGMPPNGRLSTTEIQRIEAWMRDGAGCD